MQFGHPEEYLTRLPRRGARDCIAIEIAFSIETIVTIELIMVSITVITLELGIMSIFANETVDTITIEMTISCRGCWGIRSAQWQGELDGPDVTGRDVSWYLVDLPVVLICPLDNGIGLVFLGEKTRRCRASLLARCCVELPLELLLGGVT